MGVFTVHSLSVGQASEHIGANWGRGTQRPSQSLEALDEKNTGAIFLLQGDSGLYPDFFKF